MPGTEDKLREIELRRERWLKERVKETQRKQTSKDSQTAIVKQSKGVRCSSIGAEKHGSKRNAIPAKEQVVTRGKPDSPRLIDITTEQVRDNQVTKHMESYLASQLMSHTCPICYELMKGENRAPVLVFPCGHTFCSCCLTKYCGGHKTNQVGQQKTCPCCRTEITSSAINHSLRQLIESFLQSRVHLLEGKQACDPPTDSVPSTSAFGNIHEYNDQLSSLQMRIDILENEKLDAERQLCTAQKKASAFQRAYSSLEKEENEAIEQLEQAKQQLELVRKHLNDTDTKKQEALLAVDSAKSKIHLVGSSMDNLQNQFDKITLLLEAKQSG